MRNLLIAFLLFSFSLSLQIPHRYTDSLFAVEEPLSQIVYATAPELNSPYFGESFTHDEDLSIRIFRPANDDVEKRPAIICIHGGAFVSGNLNHDDMIAFCELFASRGYVTASIQYRLGMNPINVSSSERAVYRGLQDSRAAIRYLKEYADQYGIDTNNVYLLGSSAGAFASLHNVFMNKNEERPATTFNSPDLGSYDAIANQYKHSGQPDAVIALWGALRNTSLIQNGDEQIPIFLVHGTADEIVPIGIDHPFGLSFYPETYGSRAIAEKFIEIGYPHETYFVEGGGHEFYGASNGNWSTGPNTYWDTIATKSVQFLYNQHKPTANFESFAEGSTVTFFDFSTQNIVNWHWDFGDGETSDEQSPTHTYTEEGQYKVVLTVKNVIASWDTTNALVNVSITGLTSEYSTLPEDFNLSQNYPNPFNPTTTIEYTVPRSVMLNSFQHLNSETPKQARLADGQVRGDFAKVRLVIYDILGNEVATLVNENKLPGTYNVKWSAINYPSGLYIYKLTTDTNSASKKMILLK